MELEEKGVLLIDFWINRMMSLLDVGEVGSAQEGELNQRAIEVLRNLDRCVVYSLSS